MLRSLLRIAPFVFLLGGQERYEFTEVHMGMPVRIVLYAGTDSAARAAARAAFARIAELDNTFSDYRPQSEVRRLSARAGEWVEVSPELFEVMTLSLRVAKESRGAFDPTAAPLVVVWREARRTGILPSRSRIDSARMLVGYSRVSLDASRRAVRLAPGTSLDFGGVAKGYIIGEAKRTLARAGITSVLIEAGGDIVTGDAPPGLRGWTIGASIATARLQKDLRWGINRAVSTSGPEPQNVLVDSVRYSHVVDPRTGMALTNNVFATVVGRDPAMTDAVGTAATVLGPDSLFFVEHLVESVEVRVAPLVWISHPVFVDGPNQRRRRDTVLSHDQIPSKPDVPGRRPD